MDRETQINVLLRALSRVLGWTYTLSWSASFYPQPWLNWKRRSTHGLAIDFPTLNVLGFVCYTISTACFLYAPLIRAQYAERRPGAPEPTVRFNDLVFGIHATFLVSITYSQFFSSLWGFDVSSSQRASRPITGIVIGSLLSILIIFSVVLVQILKGHAGAFAWTWIDVIYTIGYIKLVATFVKYIPQVWVNYKRKSTEGWSIGQILFDLIGGVLSIFQLIIDASFQKDWSGITGNPVKLGLGYISIIFDIIFITQHYVLYRSVPSVDHRPEDAEAIQPLIDHD